MEKIKIFFLLPSLHGGGAERVISIILSEIDRTQFECYLILLKKEGKFLNDIPDDINVIDLKCNRVRSSIFKIIKLAWKIRPKIVFTGIIHLSMLVIIFRFLFPKHTKFIARETTILGIHINASEKRPLMLKFLIKRFYTGFDLIIGQSASMKSDLVNNFGVPPERIEIISNPIDINRIEILASATQSVIDPTKKNLLAVGRLSPEKGLDLLLEAFADLIKETNNVVLNIMGIGEQEEFLRKLAHDLAISEFVRFLGFSNNPYPIMSAADVVVLTSRYDGFPNTVLESIACGTPVVAFDCPGGVNEILIPNENGWLVPCGDVLAFSKVMGRALHHQIDKGVARGTLLPRYESKFIVKRFEMAFKNTIQDETT